MPPSRTTPLTATTRRHGRFGHVKDLIQHIWISSVLPIFHPVRDIFLAPLGLLTLEFIRGTGWYPSKYVSLLLLLAVGCGVVQLSVDSQFYIRQDNLHVFVQSSYEVSGFDSYLAPQDIWDFTRLVGGHILWQNPRAVRNAVRANPFVSDAKVTLLLPATIVVTVREAAPALFWITEEGYYAVTHDGQARRVQAPDTQTQLPYLTLYDWHAHAALNRSSRHAVIARQLDPDIIGAILEIQERYRQASFWQKPPNHFTFTQDHGLQFTASTFGPRIYWGNGLHTAPKLANLVRIEAYLAEQELEADLIDLRPISRPYFR